MSNKRVLLKDIAQRSGLTINTVSRALKDKEDISIETKKEIRRLAIEMGYIPDTVASSLRSGQTKIIGVMYDNIANPYYMIMTELLHNKLHDEGYEMMIYTNFGDHSKLDLDNFNLMLSRRLDGIITFLEPTDEVIQIAKKNSIPIVLIGREGEDIGIDSIYTDDLQGGYLMGEYLFNKGHKNIGYIGAPIEIKCSIKRIEGAKKYYKDHDVIINEDNIRWLRHYQNNLHEEIDQLVKTDITAIFCFNDSMSYESMVYLKKMYPNKRIQVTGYDNISSRLMIPVDLATIDTDKNLMVNDCVNALIRRIKNFDTNTYTSIHQTRLII